jgi:ornithine carbamoyltransferase
MNHFLDIHLTAPDHLHSIISNAREMKTARAGCPRGMADDDQPWPGGWWR